MKIEGEKEKFNNEKSHQMKVIKFTHTKKIISTCESDVFFRIDGQNSPELLKAPCLEVCAGGFVCNLKQLPQGSTP